MNIKSVNFYRNILKLLTRKKIAGDNVSVKHIYHLADLHIRPVERIDEYQFVLNNLLSIFSFSLYPNTRGFFPLLAS